KFALLSGASIVALLVNLAPVWADDLVVDPAFANSPYTAVDGDYDTVTIGDTGAGIYQRIDGQTADIMVLSDFTLGKNVGSSGQIKLDNGSTLRVVFDDGFVGRQSPQEIGTGAGTGTIEIHNGSKLILASEIGANAEESSRYILGSQTGGRMTIDVSGAGSSIETDFEGSINTTVGFAGITLNNADLTVSDGGNLTSAFTSHNSYALRNGGLVADFGSTALITGAQTTATLGALSAFHGGGITIADGAQVETKGVEAFLRPTSLFHIQGGDIHVTGAQTVVRWAGDDAFAPFTEIMADDDGTAGSLLIDGGATVQDTVLGMSVTRGSNGGSGSLTIDGAGSSYNASYAALGNVNTGAPQIITISNGGALNLDGTALITHRTPYGAGNLTLLGNARLNVDGPGSILDIRNNNWNPRGAKPGSIVFEQYDINRSENNVITVSNGGSIKAREFVTTNNEKNASRVKATINIGAAAGDAAQAAGTLDVAAINTTLTTHGYTNDRTYTDGGPGGRIDLVFNHTQNDYEFDPTILNQTHVNVVAGRTILTADNSYSAGTETHAGATLQIGAGGREGWIIGDVVNDGTTAFDREDQVDFTGSFSGSGLIEQRGAGTLRLSGDSSSFTGITNIDNGTLLVDGILGGTVNDVVDGGRIGGAGTIKQDLNVGTGGVLLGRSGQILTVDGNLTLASGSVTQVALGAPEQTGLFNVGGDLTIDGTMNVTNLNGDFGLGIYRIFNYDGTLTDNGMVLGTAEDADLSQMSIQTNVDHQVNLVYSNGDTTPVVFWDGGEASLHQNGKIDGGDGIWSLPANTNWTDQTGAVNGAWTNGAFAIFTAKPGTVRVDDSAGDIIADGMQFAVDGYKVTGDAITLSGDNVPVIRVDGGATAVVESELRGSMGLRKTDYGTLVLAGDNSYSGGTTVNEGVLQLGNGGTTGSIKGDVTLAKTDHDVGTLAFNHSNAFTFSGNITGAGDVIQNGTGLTTLAGNNAFAGGLLVARGTLQAGSNTAFGGGKLSINQGAVADLAGFGQSVTAMVNNGSFRFGGTGGTSFNVSGDYSGNNGILVMNTTLGGDASNT
ncbi:beta strand repeat-containing protein, partial [Ochrobactrum quorumnocens]